MLSSATGEDMVTNMGPHSAGASVPSDSRNLQVPL